MQRPSGTVTSFQSTPARERATVNPGQCLGGLEVSIHARSRAGDPQMRRTATSSGVSIHARSRAGDVARRAAIPYYWFQSTPARERATGWASHVLVENCVSIHARSRAGDRGPPGAPASRNGFNPRPLASGRLLHMQVWQKQRVRQRSSRTRTTRATKNDFAARHPPLCTCQ